MEEHFELKSTCGLRFHRDLCFHLMAAFYHFDGIGAASISKFCACAETFSKKQLFARAPTRHLFLPWSNRPMSFDWRTLSHLFQIQGEKTSLRLNFVDFDLVTLPYCPLFTKPILPGLVLPSQKQAGIGTFKSKSTKFCLKPDMSPCT